MPTSTLRRLISARQRRTRARRPKLTQEQQGIDVLKRLATHKLGQDNVPDFNDEDALKDFCVDVTAKDVARFLEWVAYGLNDHTATDRPIYARQNGLKGLKTKLSFIIKRFRGVNGWDPQSLTGNPTYSNEVHDILKQVKKSEVRGTGIYKKLIINKNFIKFQVIKLF